MRERRILPLVFAGIILGLIVTLFINEQTLGSAAILSFVNIALIIMIVVIATYALVSVYKKFMG